jgi:hypothetical protein
VRGIGTLSKSLDDFGNLQGFEAGADAVETKYVWRQSR